MTPKSPPRGCSSYLNSLKQESIRGSVKWLIKTLKCREFDAVAVRGTSGLVAGSIVAFAMKKVLCVVRKTTEKSHADTGRIVEIFGTLPTSFRYVIIDDMRATGVTCIAINEAMKEVGGELVYELFYSGRYVTDAKGKVS
jgi:adenine/guanine phosphoribosyltransferase-like PRPP-binding protein